MHVVVVVEKSISTFLLHDRVSVFARMSVLFRTIFSRCLHVVTLGSSSLDIFFIRELLAEADSMFG